MLGPILNSHKNVKLTDSWGMWRRVWGLMEKDGTYIVWWGWWLVEENGTYGASGFLFGVFNIYIWGFRWVMCMDQSVREEFVLMPTFWKDFRFFIL